jgi:hypothetical protein
MLVGIISRRDLLQHTVKAEDVQDAAADEVKACSGAR